MAKKTESKLSYLQMPLPESRKHYKMTKRSWNGLNYRQTIDTGALSMEKNISTLEAPYLVPSQKWGVQRVSSSSAQVGLFGFDDILVQLYIIESSQKMCIRWQRNSESAYFTSYTVGEHVSDALCPRCVVLFNVYDSPTDPVTGEYAKKLLIFPDKVSINFNVDTNGFGLCDMEALVKEYYNDESETDESGATIYPPPDTASHNYYYKNTYNEEVYRWCEYDTNAGGTAYGWKVSVPPAIPGIKYATVYLSRLFGVDNDRVYASGYNDYTNWNLDTVDEYNESNAWCSPAQANTKANGAFTGITTFQNHVVCFKRDFMHEIYNTKNPFRIQDIYGEGTIDNRTICDVDGRLIFVSEDNVKIYTGSNPRIISYYLNMSEYEKAVSGTDGRCYYLYCEDADENKRLFVYDTISECWSEQEVDFAVINFAHNKNGMYALGDNGGVYKIDTGSFAHNWSFETDLFTNETVDIKHIKKLQMLADIASGANIKVYILYDDEEFDEDTSHLVYESSGHGQKPIRVKPRQTASYGIKLHIEGYGYVKLYELELFMETGGDLYA